MQFGIDKAEGFCYTGKAVSETGVETPERADSERTLKTIQRKRVQIEQTCEDGREAGARKRDQNSQNSMSKTP